MTMTLYDFHDSGNGYKVRLLLSHLGLAYRYVEIDILSGESRTPDFLAKNPNGRIPVLELPDGAFLSESNAILFYLAQDTRYLPDDRLASAQVMQWMFFEQYSHEPNVATVRFWRKHLELDDDRQKRIEEKTVLGHAALDVMERHLAGRTFMVGEHYTIADIALYAYTHVADEGGFDLSPYVAVCAWLERVRVQPGYVPLHPV